ncbi:MAG TPA: cupin domain-containing protein [Gaiellaceae bacterium]|nr:cupin domain-containing protein [Gaiellaceae bacterium]
MEEPGLRAPGFRLVRADARLDERAYTTDLPWRPVAFTGTAEPERVVAAFAAGATLVLQGLHLHRLQTAAFCRELEAYLGHPAQLNAYFTPRRSQGLPVHHDTHDVFVLQVSGRKRWLVYDPVWELPLKHQRYVASMGAPGETVLDVVLEAGDTLYLPRGWMHEALTSDEDSLHLTVGINVAAWVDALKAALSRTEADVAARRSVPPDGVGGAELLERLGAELEPEVVARARRRAFVLSRRPILDGQLEQLRRLDEITAATVVERRATVIAELEDDVLRFEGKELRFPAQALDPLGALVEAEASVCLADLPGRLDGDGRVVLARRLVREGFLVAR